MYGEQKTWHYSNQRKARVELPGEGDVVVNRTYKVKPPLNKKLLEESVSLFREELLIMSTRKMTCLELVGRREENSLLMS